MVSQVALDGGGNLTEGWANVSAAPVFPVLVVLIFAFSIACAFMDVRIVWDDILFVCSMLKSAIIPEICTCDAAQVLTRCDYNPQVWDMVIDTIFQCYCMDEEYGSGKTPGEMRKLTAENPPSAGDLKAITAVTTGNPKA